MAIVLTRFPLFDGSQIQISVFSLSKRHVNLIIKITSTVRWICLVLQHKDLVFQVLRDLQIIWHVGHELQGQHYIDSLTSSLNIMLISWHNLSLIGLSISVS